MSALGDRLRQLSDLAHSLGPAHAARHKLQHAWHRVQAPQEPYTLTTREAAFPLWCRPDTSDETVFWQVFVDLQYAPLIPRKEPRFILDCGANVGYTSAYFLTRFPTARVFAVEPDPGNAELLRHNLAPYGRRYTIFQTGVWSRPVGLVMSTTPFRDGREWARQVREAQPDETPEMFAADIPSLIEESGEERVGILKMDIEGAETEVFSADCSSWISRVDAFVVEVHGEIAARTFAKALGPSDFDISRHGEVTVALRRRH
jgi:FkbM family methyltransferase